MDDDVVVDDLDLFRTGGPWSCRAGEQPATSYRDGEARHPEGGRCCNDVRDC
jgi:hypothetical protein